jgi:DNA-binding IscR family transcriptional regulator
MATDSSEVDAQNVLRALNELRRERGAEFTVTSTTLQQRAATDATTVERVMQRLQAREGVVVREKGAGQWTVRRS